MGCRALPLGCPIIGKDICCCECNKQNTCEFVCYGFPKTLNQCDYYDIEPLYNYVPMGIKPRKIWLMERRNDLINAMNRYHRKNLDFPSEWIEEYEELTTEINRIMTEEK